MTGITRNTRMQIIDAERQVGIRKRRPLPLAGWWWFVLYLGLTGIAQASDFYVGITTDAISAPADCTNSGNSDCSLREAISAANADVTASNASPHIIHLPAGTYAITIAGSGEDINATGDYDVTKPISIIGAGSGSTIIDANSVDRLFDVRTAGVDIALSSVKLANGNSGAANGGCVFYNMGGVGNITVSNSIIDGCDGAQGGALYTNSSSTITIIGSTLSNNTGTSDGGAMYGGTFAISGASSFTSNSSGGSGGAIYALGTVNSTGATFGGAAGNGNHADTATKRGGAVYVAGAGTFTDCTISYNTSAQNGGGIYGGAGITITNSTISYNTATLGNGGGVYAAGTLTINATTTIDHNGAGNGSGGGAYSGSNASVTGATITWNTSTTTGTVAFYGGGIAVAGNSTFDSTTISNNTISTIYGKGGGIGTVGSVTVTVQNNSTISNNTASASQGGGVFGSGAVTINDSTVSANQTGGAYHGGGVYSGGLFTASGSDFTSNLTGAAGGNGGAVWTNAGASISNSTFTTNTAAGGGGAVFNNSATVAVTVTGATFDTNSATGGSGGAINTAKGFSITGSTFASNSATTTGGAIYNTGAGGSCQGANTFSANHANGSGGQAGGAIYSNTQTVSITEAGTTFTANYGGGSGGAVYVSAAFNVSAATTFDSNYTTTGGGGAVICKGGSISETTFKANHAIDYAGALYFVTMAGSVSNTTFESNYVNGGANNYGGAFYSNVGGTTFTNTTFSANTAANGGAIYNTGVCTIKNSTFYDNDASSGSGDHIGCVNGTLTNSVIYSATPPATSLCYGVPNGTNNIKYGHDASQCGSSSTNGDPLLAALANNGGNTKTHALNSGSPAFDTGDVATCNAAPVNNLDQRGMARTTSDTLCDKGAYEHQTITISGTLYADEGTTTINTGPTVRLIANGVSVGTDAADGSGVYAITTSVTSGDAIIAYIDANGGTVGNAVTVANGANLGGLNIYADRVITRHDNGGSLTNALMGTALGAYSDTDILYSVSGGNLTANGTGIELMVWSGHTFAPGGTVTTTHMDIDGTLTTAANAINVAGNWDATGGVFTSSGTVTFNAASGTLTITPGGVDADHDFQHIVFNDAAGTATYQLGGAIDADGDFTVTDGIFDTTASNYAVTVAGALSDSANGRFKANGSTVTVGGDVSLNTNNDATESTDFNTATLVLNGAASNINYTSLASWWSNGFNNLTVGQGGVTDTLNNWLTVKGTLTIGTGGLTSPATTTLALTKAGDALVFDAASTLSIDTLMFLKYGGGQNLPHLTNGYSCHISLAGGSSLVVSQTGDVTLNSGKNLLLTGDNDTSRALSLNTNGFALTVGGNLVIGAGGDTGAKGLEANGSTITVRGNFTVNAGANTFSAGTSTVVLNGTGQGISGSTTFHNLSKGVTSADTLTFQAGSTTTINGTVTLNGVDGQLLTLSSSSGSSAWNFVVNASATKAIGYVSVSWSDASGSHATQRPIAPSNSTNGGHTIDWFAVLLPSITVLKSSTLISDPVNGVSSPLHIPGAIIGYQIQTTNSGAASPDADTVVVIDALDAGAVEFDVSTGIIFTANTSGLSLASVSYAHTATPTSYTYTPTGPYDADVAGLKVTTSGTLATGGANFTVGFRVRVK